MFSQSDKYVINFGKKDFFIKILKCVTISSICFTIYLLNFELTVYYTYSLIHLVRKNIKIIIFEK